MRKIKILLLITILFSFIFTGCAWDSKEIDDQVYPVIIGADKGVDNRIRVTIQFPFYKEGGGGGGGMQKGSGGGGGEEETGKVGNTLVQTVEASSILEAINLMNTSVSRRISLVHVKAIVFSENFARQGIQSYLEPLARFREARRIMQVLICKGTAEDYIMENKTNIGESLPKAMEEMIVQSRNTGFFPRASFQTFYRGILSPYGHAFAVYTALNDFSSLKPIPESPSLSSPLKTQYELLPGDVPRKGDLKNETIGTAVFVGDKMLGVLNSYETRYFLMVNGQFERGTFTFEDKNSPGNVIPFDLRPGRKPKIKVTFENGTPLINVMLNIEADIGAVQSRIPYEKLDRISELNNLLEETIRDGVKRTIEKTQKEWNSDIFSFGYYAAGHFFTIQEYKNFNWNNHYRDAKVNVEVLANVRRTGLMAESSAIIQNNNE